VLLQFEGHILDPARRELTRMGAIVPMEPQVFDLLLYLIRNRDRVVSKGDLIAGVWNGRIVSESTLATRINAARRVLGDDGKQQRFIRTAARKGIRFVSSVREEPDPATGGAERPDASPGAPCCASWRDCVPADDPGADQTRLAPAPIVDRPSIAVLPFENMSDDRALELLADGLVEDVIALLARVPGFFVIARASSFVYRPMSLEARQVGMELGVRYVVTGSVRGSEGRVRVTTQLIEAETGTQLWGARYDVERGDTLDLQDRIAREIIAELEPALTKAELLVIRRRRTESVDAWSHFRQASGVIAQGGWNEETLGEATGHLRRAILADPEFALARAMLALYSAFGAIMFMLGNAAEAKRDAFAEAERAVAVDPNGSDVLGYAGCAFSSLGEVKRGCELLDRAVELDPSNAQARVALGAAQIRLKDFDRGAENMRLGMRLSPRDFRLAFWGMVLAKGLVRAGRLEEALAEAAIASRRDARLYTSRVVTAWAMARLGRIEEARHALSEARRIRPRLSLEEIRRFFTPDAAEALSALWG
jgi:TolB-like protein/DNA-binding winged helix-turn-helix (wHTH) protein